MEYNLHFVHLTSFEVIKIELPTIISLVKSHWQIYYKMLKNHTTKANFYLKNLKKATAGTQYLEDSKF